MNLDEFDLLEGSTQQPVLNGLTVRSSVTSGVISSLRVPKLPPRYTAVGIKDIPGENALRLFNTSMPYLASEKIDFFGHPLLLLAGPNEMVLRRLSAKIDIQYTRDSEHKPSAKANKAFDEPFEFIRGDCDGALKRAERIVEGEYVTRAQACSHPRPLSSLAIWHRGTIIVYCSSAHPYLTQSNIANLLSIPLKRVRIIVPSHMEDPGGNVVGHTLLAGHVSLLCFLTKQAVKMEYSWNESTDALPRRHPCTVKYRTGIDTEGRILGMDVSVEMDAGAYGPLSMRALQRTAISAVGSYACENVRVTGRLYRTRQTSYYGCAGLGEPQGFFAEELHSARVAEAAGLDPVAWKRQNIVKPGESFPVGGRLSETDGPLLVLEDVISRSDFVRKNGANEANKKKRGGILGSTAPLRGIGLALCFHGIGMLGLYEKEEPSTVRVQLSTNQRVYIMSSTATSESRSVYQALAANLLNIPATDVVIEEIDTATVPNSGPAWGSRWLLPIGQMIQDCFKSLSVRRLKNSPPITVRRTYRPSDKLTWSWDNPKANPYQALCWEATVVEVEVDPVTLESQCKGVWVTLDGGKIPTGNLFTTKAEEGVITELASAVMNFPVADYRLAPNAQIRFVETENPKGPGGIKGLGDRAVVGAAPAFVLAVSQAVGYPFDELPLPPETIQGRLSQ